MSQIKINFDMIHVIKEAKGIKNCPKGYSSLCIPITLVLPTAVLACAIQENLSAESTIFLCTATAGVSFGLEQILLNIMVKKSTIALAESELKYLALLLNKLGIKTNSELLLDSEVYSTEYSLKKDSPVGIIRNRYINIPRYNYKGEKVLTSIREDHLIPSNEYFISVGEPIEKEKKVMRKVLGTV